MPSSCWSSVRIACIWRRSLRASDAAGHRQADGVIGDRDVLQPEIACGARHGLDRVGAVGPVGLGLEIAAQGAVLDELRQAPLAGRPAISPWSSRSSGGTHAKPRRAYTSSSVRPATPARAAKQAVLVELESLRDGELPERDVVRLAAGEIDERGAEAPGGNDAQVDLESAAQPDARAGGASSEDALDLGQRDERVHDARRPARDDQQVGVADRLAPSPDRARDHGRLRAGDRGESSRQVLHDRQDRREQVATPGGRDGGQRPQDVLLAALAEAGERADLARSRGGRRSSIVRTPSVS